MTPTNTRTKGTVEGQAAAARIAAAKATRDSSRRLNRGGVRVQNSADRAAATTPVTTPAPTTPGPITTATLAPTTPMKLGEPTPATQATGMMEEFADTNDTYTRDLEAKAEALNAPAKTAFADYLSQLQNAKGQTQLTSEAYAQEGGVDAITPELNDINDKIRREQLNMRRRTEAIQAGGGLKAGAASEIANIERESFAKQADLSIIQLAVQGRYDSAKEIADRAVAAQFEQQANDLAILKFNYEENKELFTKAEQRAFEAAQGDRERKLEAEKQNKQDMYNLGVQASADGAPSSVVQKMFQAKTREEALAIGGSYIGALDREAKRASIRSSNASAALNEAELIAYNKAQEDAAAGILSGDQVEIAQGINKDFEDEPIVKAYNEGLQKSIVLEDTLANGISGVQDLQLVYDFMKAVDPTSVVRETEFDNAAKTGNIFQGTYARFNGKLRTGGFLPQEVKDDFIRSARSSFDAKNTQYYNVKAEKAKQVNQRLGIQNGADYLTSYESAAPLTQVDLNLADNLSDASEQDIQEIMFYVNTGTLPNSSPQY